MLLSCNVAATNDMFASMADSDSVGDDSQISGEVVMYLKYYLALRGDQLVLDSVACRSGWLPTEPNDFVEWFDPKDWEYMAPEHSMLPDGTLNLFGGTFVRKKNA
jgi:hypothetical protein